MALAWYLDGRVSALVGTHTHVQTADERILPQGTAFISDVGMVGPRDSVLGVDKEIVIKKFLSGLPAKFSLAKGENIFCAVLIELDNFSGKASHIQRIQKYL
jgi:calcineurin-like phosphoesterase